MKDPYGRDITYLRVSVTDRCNLRCHYCMPAEGVPLLPREEILTFEEIADVVREAVRIGVRKVRLTGGEPLVRHGIVDLTRLLAATPGIDDFGMTTNGLLLPRYARELKAAGLHRLNISLDTLDPERFAVISRGGDVGDVLAGIAAAEAAGFSPIKLNCVVSDSRDEADAQAVRAFGADRGHEVRFIRMMDLPTGRFSVVDGGDGGNCPCCNRLRLTSDGWVHPCLFGNIRYHVRELGPAEALRRAIAVKPLSGHCSSFAMSRLGG